MTEIERAKTFWKRSSGEIITYTEGTLMDIIQLARRDILSLITTIEAQKEEIERWNSLRPEVKWFAEQMELVLRENDHKCGWKDEHQTWLLGELFRNAGKIFDSGYDLRRVVNTANFAMMIADNSRIEEKAKLCKHGSNVNIFCVRCEEEVIQEGDK